MSAVADRRPIPRRPLWWTFADAAAVTRRNLYRYVRVPTLLLFSTIQPVMFVLLFTFVFGGAIQVPGVDNYIDFLMAGILAQTVIFGSTQTGVALAEDMSRGMVDRFRSLPMARSAVLAGRTLSDTVRNLFVVGLMLVVGTLVGFRFHAGFLAAVGAVAVHEADDGFAGREACGRGDDDVAARLQDEGVDVYHGFDADQHAADQGQTVDGRR